MTVHVDVHAIQPVGPSNLNRDLNGSPKTATYGGVRRARVSSQSWKRPIRLDFREKYSPENMGIRTKRIVELLSDAITEEAPDLADEAVAIAVEAFTRAGIKIVKPKVKKGEVLTAADYQPGYLVFLSQRQIENAAQIAAEAYREEGMQGVKDARRDLKNALRSDLSVDLALFGRMVADDTDLNVDASCQVAHAISTHAVGTEFDFFTAVDDQKAQSDDTDAGAGMMGTVEFNSATFYRYATINATALAEQLGSDEAAVRAIEGFIDVFATAMPTGKQNTFAAHTLPAAVTVSVREGRPMSLVGAFETPVYSRRHPDAPATGYTGESVRRMLTYEQDLESGYGRPGTVNISFGVGEAATTIQEVAPHREMVASILDLAKATGDVVRQKLEES